MAAPNVKDLATSLVTVAPSPADSGTELSITNGEEPRFPAVPFNATVCPADELPTLDNSEIVLVTSVTANAFTITRAQGVSSAKSIETGWRIFNGIYGAHVAGAYDRSNHTGSQSISTLTGTANRIIYTDESGNVSDDGFEYLEQHVDVGGGIMYHSNSINPLEWDNLTDPTIGFVDLTELGGAKNLVLNMGADGGVIFSDGANTYVNITADGFQLADTGARVTNIATDLTSELDTEIPTVKAVSDAIAGIGGGGGSLSIGDAIGSSTPGRLLAVDGSGNLTNYAMVAVDLPLAGGMVNIPGITGINPISGDAVTGISYTAIDATALGGGQTLAQAVRSGVKSANYLLDIDTFTIYRAETHIGDGTANFSWSTNPSIGESMTLTTSGLILFETGAAITEFSTDGTLGDNSDTAVPTEKAVKTYVDANASGLPDQTGNSGKFLTTDGSSASWDDVATVGGSDTEVQYNNAGVMDGENWFTVDTANNRVRIGTTSFYNGSHSIPNYLDMTGRFSLIHQSTYTGGSQESAFRAITYANNSAGAGYIGLEGSVRTTGAATSAAILTGLTGGALTQHPSGTLTLVRGLSAGIGHNGAGTISTAVALDIDALGNYGGGTIGVGYGIRVGSVSGASTNVALHTSNGLIVFNEGGDANSDVRIEGDTDQNLLFTDASADKVGIGMNNPNSKLDVNGTIQADGLRLDVTPTAETISPTHTITISVNGTNYKIPLVAA